MRGNCGEPVSADWHGPGVGRFICCPNRSTASRARRRPCRGEPRRTLGGSIRFLSYRGNILHVDATIRIIDPANQVDTIVPKVRRLRRDWFGRGGLLWSILETLRKAPEPLTAREITLALMERKGFDANDAATVRLVERRVDSTVRRREGLIERVAHGPRSVGWRVAPTHDEPSPPRGGRGCVAAPPPFPTTSAALPGGHLARLV